MAAITQAYQSLLDQNRIIADKAQAQAVQRLAMLQVQWETPQKKGLLASLFGKQESQTPQGLYLWGDVGRGKSLLADLLYENIEVAPKRRVHYHAFMLEIHARIHRWREENRADLKSKDPILPLAAAIAKESQFLCLDEMQVTDVADAMILGRLFTAILSHGVRVVFTSNRKPSALYLNGLQRDRFLPFIALLEQQLDVIELASAEDYRLRQLKSLQDTYMVGAGEEVKARMDKAFHCLTHGAEPETMNLEVQGRALAVSCCYGDVARFSFAELCAKPLGAADYEALAQEFSSILMDDIPLLTPEKRNEAKRFLTFVDVLYEHKVKLICSAIVPPQDLYPAGDGNFEFARTISRLMEMQSENYLALAVKH